jgi:hypothetical protein
MGRYYPLKTRHPGAAEIDMSDKEPTRFIGIDLGKEPSRTVYTCQRCMASAESIEGIVHKSTCPAANQSGEK